MQITPVSKVLASVGLDSPVLNVLLPDEDNYKVLLMQPQGGIEADTTGVRNRDRALSQRQFSEFLKEAQNTGADLAVTPEYSTPWNALVNAIKDHVYPEEGKLWALGCESIKYSELETLKNDLSPLAEVIYERIGADPLRFTDPLAYVFRAPSGQGATRLVVLVQFKTCPMGRDADHFETNGLQSGKVVYVFGSEEKLRLITLICSDVFAFDEGDYAKIVYHQSLILHIQLNRNPRQPKYRHYRDRLFEYVGDRTELICLNWAEDVEEWSPRGKSDWENIGGSAWYLRPDRFDYRDETLVANHRRGLYYTWLKGTRAHALFFNYQPAVFELLASKVAHIGVLAVKSYRVGPKLMVTRNWRDSETSWAVQPSVEDGFSALVAESGRGKVELKVIADRNPIEAERVLALSAGEIKHGDDWHSVRCLDSCVIDASEVIHRITFCQDTDERACKFRTARLKRFAHLWDILMKRDCLPPALVDLKDGFGFQWSLASPNQNVISAKGIRATVVYMGEESSAAQIEGTAKTISENLRLASPDVDQTLLARQRLAVWFRTGEEIALFDPLRYTKIDQTGKTSEYDIAREQ
jgi:hypothetical protein